MVFYLKCLPNFCHLDRCQCTFETKTLYLYSFSCLSQFSFLCVMSLFRCGCLCVCVTEQWCLSVFCVDGWRWCHRSFHWPRPLSAAVTSGYGTQPTLYSDMCSVFPKMNLRHHCLLSYCLAFSICDIYVCVQGGASITSVRWAWRVTLRPVGWWW